MKLLIVESPGKVKKIQGFLGDGWRVAASVGHVRDLPKSEIGVAPPDFKPRYVETERGGKVVADLRKLASAAESVWLATDPDREGEAIAWHLAEALRLKDPRRVSYSEITESAVKAALDNPRPIDLALVRAQEGRRVLDRIVGYMVSPAIGDAAGKTLSAGRVQSPAVRLVVEREEAIRSFRQTTHFGVEAVMDAVAGVSDGWRAVWRSKAWLGDGEEYFLDKDAAETVAGVRTLTVVSYEEGEARAAPPPPFTTSTLQQAASNALRLDPQETMAVAQRLYEDGHITYMRTDSPNLSLEAVEAIRGLASERDWPLPPKPRTWKAKEGAQEAHEAIRPTHPEAEDAGGDDKARELYRMIRLRALASQLDDSRYATAKAVLKGEAGGREVLFDAKGRRLESPGWRILTGEDQADETPREGELEEMGNPVPPLRGGSQVVVGSARVLTRKTSAPPRFTQAALIRDLERRGIGRPSTYAAIMDNIADRGYVKADKKRRLEATPLGEELVSYLRSRFGFVDYDFTGGLEAKLDGVAGGAADYLSLVSEVYAMVEGEIDEFRASRGLACPDCGKPLRHLVKDGPGGWDFWACSDREACGAKFEDDGGKPGRRSGAAVLSEHKCDACGKPLRHVVKEGEGGWDFWGCSDRSCGATYGDDGGKPGKRRIRSEPSKFKCPACKGPLYRRQGVSAKTGKEYDFFSCADRSCSKTYNAVDGKPDFPEKGKKTK